MFQLSDSFTVISPTRTQILSDLFLLGATVGLGLEEVYELGLLGDGPLHFHLLMGVHGLQVELSEHHYCHEFLLKYFTSHREGDRGTEKGGGWSKEQNKKKGCGGKKNCFGVWGCLCLSPLKQRVRTEGEKTRLQTTERFAPSPCSDCELITSESVCVCCVFLWIYIGRIVCMSV